MDNLDSFSSFLEDKKEQKERTRKQNLKLIKRLLREISPLTCDGLDIFIKSLIEKRNAPSYIRQFIIIGNQWGEFIGDKDLQNFPIPKFNYKSKFECGTFSDAEVIQFLSLPNPWDGKDDRPYIKAYFERHKMWLMFYDIAFYHGMRKWEIAQLTTDMLKFGLESYFDLPEEITKTNDARKVPMAPDKIEKIREYVNSLKGKCLFYSPDDPNQHIAPNTWLRFFNNQLKRMNAVKGDRRPYSTRHTYGTRHKKVPLKTLMKIMGHKRADTALRYQHPNMDDMREVQENDRLRDFNKSSEEHLLDVYLKQKDLENKYLHKLHAEILLSKDRKKISIVFEVPQLEQQSGELKRF